MVTRYEERKHNVRRRAQNLGAQQHLRMGDALYLGNVVLCASTPGRAAKAVVEAGSPPKLAQLGTTSLAGGARTELKAYWRPLWRQRLPSLPATGDCWRGAVLNSARGYRGHACA